MARRKVPHAKYVNFRNDRLVIVFAHLLPHFKALQDVDSVLLSLCYLPFCNCPCWKMMKYSTVNNVAFVEAPETLGKKRRKLLKEAATRWFSHGEAFKRLIARFSCLIDALDVILEKGADQEVKGVLDELLQPDTILLLLLLADVLAHLNRFLLFYQR